MSGAEGGYYPLKDAVEQLAFEGHPDPSGEMLRRLCAGEWTAFGHWSWVVWAGDTFQQHRYGVIPVERWEGLNDALARGVSIEGGGKLLPNFSDESRFPKGSPWEEMASWEWRDGQFRMALLLGPNNEEWFVADEIDVREQRLLSGPEDAATPPLEGPTGLTTNRGGRPPATDWEAAVLAIAGRYYRGDFKPGSVADIIRALQDWAVASGLELPDTTARPHARRIFEAFQAWEAD
ncbi:hypothetical protein [Brevundimonas sp. DC300-4]|uniref:hypothetical protein n=1 Tax=Brevundimonas sp. DC300-4 TaxID=2804594 RepID=UPI003CEAE458